MTLWLFDQLGHSTPSAPSGAVADHVCADTYGDTPETNGACGTDPGSRAAR